MSVELDALRPIHVQVAEERGLPSAEAVVRNGHGDRNVDTDHPSLDIELELPCGPTIAGKNRGAIAVRIIVDQFQRLFEI